jgi:hypothetical protein
MTDFLDLPDLAREAARGAALALAGNAPGMLPADETRPPEPGKTT